MNKITFEAYTRPNGHNEFKEWLVRLPEKDQKKLLAVILEAQQQGLVVAQRMQWVKKIDTNLFELRSKVGSNIQRVLYFHVKDGRFIITHGFTKKTRTTPVREKQHALEIRREWFEND